VSFYSFMKNGHTNMLVKVKGKIVREINLTNPSRPAYRIIYTLADGSRSEDTTIFDGVDALSRAEDWASRCVIEHIAPSSRYIIEPIVNTISL